MQSIFGGASQGPSSNTSSKAQTGAMGIPALAQTGIGTLLRRPGMIGPGMMPGMMPFGPAPMFAQSSAVEEADPEDAEAMIQIGSESISETDALNSTV